MNVSESVQAMKARVESLLVYQVDPDTVIPIHQVSDGSFGSLYTAEARVPAYGQTGPATARLVAVKSAGQGAGEVERAEFIGEVRLLAALQHDNISRVLGVCESKVPFFVVMEYLHHGDLTSFLRAHRPEESPYHPEESSYQLASTTSTTKSLRNTFKLYILVFKV